MANENEVSISSEFPEGVPQYPVSHPNWSTKEMENPAPNESVEESAPAETTDSDDGQELNSNPLGLDPANLPNLGETREEENKKPEAKIKK